MTSRECYGSIFPDLNDLRPNQVIKGKVFHVRIGQSGIGPVTRTTEFDGDAWRECRSCENYRECYDLSMASLSLHRTVGVLT